MANHLDFLFALDEFTRERSLGYVSRGTDMYGIASEAGLCEWGDLAPARWTGQLVHEGYLNHAPPGGGDRAPVPPGTIWNETELGRLHEFRLSPDGRTEADRLRRMRRETQTDAVLGMGRLDLSQAWMSAPQCIALATTLNSLRAALDASHHSAAIGAAKDLAESACKIALERAGLTVSRNSSLVALFTQAARSLEPPADPALGRSMSATIQRLADLRNAAGAGHGHAALPASDFRDARIAASAAIGITLFLLTAESP